MDDIRPFKPKEDNIMYRYIGTVVSYYKNGMTEAGASYIRNSVPKQLQPQVVRAANKVLSNK